MTYTEALREARRNVKNFTCGKDESGREWVEVNGKRFSKDWFIKTCARMKANGEV